MTYKTFGDVTEKSYAAYYKNEITGLYANLWAIAKKEADLAADKAKYILSEYSKYRLIELKEMSYKEYLQTGEWQSKRKTALKDADNKCQLCSVGDTELHVHHKTYERRGEELPEDLIVLCKKCHAKQHEKEIAP